MKLIKIVTFIASVFFANLTFANEADGFCQLATYDYTAGTQVYHYEHKKSGAQLVWLKNDNTNRAFTLAFPTRAYDDAGLPHIFEHACLAGSPKYPGSNLFFQMRTQTYNTFMNAITDQLVTYYPMSSLSEDQLFASLDFYMEGVFNPILLQEEKDLKREAVRFVLDSPQGQISATGAVYNEMQGILANKRYFNYFEVKKALFPDSTDSFITGGIPRDILQVDWQSVKDFHAKYYNPSNLVIYLYGKLDIDRFLKYFDEFLSKYERTETDFSDRLYKPFEGQKEIVVEFPEVKSAQTENSSIFNYALVLPDANAEEYNDLAVISLYLAQESSWLKTTIKEHFPDAVFYCDFNCLANHPYFEFVVENINEEDKEELKLIIQEAVEKLCREKLNSLYIKILANSLKMERIREEENPDFTQKMSTIMLCLGATRDPLYFLNFRENFMKLPQTSSPKSVKATARKFLKNPEQSLVLVTKPAAGLAEKKAAESADFFAQKKASMSKSEIQKLIEENREYEKWLSENEKINLIDRVKVVGAAQLPEEVKDPVIIDQKIDDMRILCSVKEKSEYVKASVLFNLNTLPYEYLHPVMLYFDLLGSMPTKKYSLDSLESRMMLSVYSANSGTDFYKLSDEYESGGTDIYARTEIVCLNEKLSASLKLGHEMLLNTSLTDYEAIRSQAGRLAKTKKQDCIQGIITDPFNSMSEEAAYVASNPSYTAGFYAENFDYWNFLETVSDYDDSQTDKLVKEIKEALTYVFNKHNLTIICIGDKKQIDQFIKAERSFAKNLGQEKLPQQNVLGHHEKLPKRLAFVIPGNANFCYQTLPLYAFNSSLDEKYGVYGVLLGDKYLMPQLRYKYGAYGTGAELSKRYIILWSYRDPEIKNTYEVYSKAADFVEGLSKNLTQEDIDGYITMCCSYLQKPLADSELISNKITDYLKHDYEQNKAVRKIRQVKATKPEDAKEFIRLLEMLEKDGARVTFGNAAQIEENKEMFDLILTDLIN